MKFAGEQTNGGPAAEPAQSLSILMAGQENERFSLLATGLWTMTEVSLQQVHSGEEVIQRLTDGLVDLLIIDETLADMSGLALTRTVARRFPFVNCMLVSDLPAAAFHEATEGLGVLLQLPSPPQMETAMTIKSHLDTIRSAWAWA